MKSPCIAACKNNEGICSGCHRTIEEIIRWKKLSDEERQTVMDTLSGHLSTHVCPSCGKPAHCGISAGQVHCWCFDLEPRDTPAGAAGQPCLCRACLAALPPR